MHPPQMMILLVGLIEQVLIVIRSNIAIEHFYLYYGIRVTVSSVFSANVSTRSLGLHE